MEGLLHQLGINLKGVIIQGIGFLIMILILWKFAFNRVIHLIDERRERIESQFRAAQERQEEVERLQEEVKRRLQEIDLESQARMREMLEEAKAERERIIAKAREEAMEELMKMQNEIEREKRRAIAELRTTVSEMAIAIAEKIVEMDLDEEKHRALIDRMIDQLTPSLLGVAEIGSGEGR
ncbi:TPA: F0F1 ATP synthase subunit B [Candidatus Poribacteria bacterium]|nr:F0F1 ATP synthase subunit B [Candidatus Poribacteria bacterium]